VEIYIARDLEEAPTSNLESRGRGKQRHGIGIEDEKRTS
jgi:hypothetical protein